MKCNAEQQQQPEQPPCCFDIFILVQFTNHRLSPPSSSTYSSLSFLRPRTAFPSCSQECLFARQQNDWRFNKVFTSLLTIHCKIFGSVIFCFGGKCPSSSITLPAAWLSILLYSDCIDLQSGSSLLCDARRFYFYLFFSRETENSGRVAITHTQQWRRVLLFKITSTSGLCLCCSCLYVPLVRLCGFVSPLIYTHLLVGLRAKINSGN